MKKKQLGEIKHGEKVFSVVATPHTFDQVVRESFLDRNTVQKALADLQKHGYICKDVKGLWSRTGDTNGEKEAGTA